MRQHLATLSHSNCVGAVLFGLLLLGAGLVLGLWTKIVLGLLGVLGTRLVLALLDVGLLLGARLLLGLLGAKLLGGGPLGVVGAVLGLLGVGLLGGGPNPIQMLSPAGRRMKGAFSFPAGSSK